VGLLTLQRESDRVQRRGYRGKFASASGLDWEAAKMEAWSSKFSSIVQQSDREGERGLDEE